MAKDTAKKIRLFADKKAEAGLTQIGTRLLSDEKFRKEFIADPGKALSYAGVTNLGDIRLSKRDVALLNLVGDSRVNELYRSGQFEELEKHILSRYQDLVNPGDVAAFAIADFDVAIEAEVVAVAVVAVAAVVIGAVERFDEINVLQARLASLEARLKTVEALDARLSALEKRLG